MTIDFHSFPQSQRYTVRVVDRIGGGDSFAAGLIHGFVSGRDSEATLKLAVAAGALKQTIPGDFNLSVAEVERLVAGDTSGRVQREWRESVSGASAVSAAAGCVLFHKELS